MGSTLFLIKLNEDVWHMFSVINGEMCYVENVEIEMERLSMITEKDWWVQ